MGIELFTQTACEPPSVSERDAGIVVRVHKRLNGYFVLFSLAGVLALMTASECRSITSIPSLVYGAVLWGWWALVASALWQLGIKRPSLTSFTAKAVTAHITIAAFLGAVHLLLLWGAGFVTHETGGYTDSTLMWRYLVNINRYGIEILIYGFVFGIIGVIQHDMRARRNKIRSLELQRQLSAAQLHALQTQMEPHFLFNTLNAITTLVELGRQTQAVEMLGHLNTILKSTLERASPEKVTLARELELVENYLAIEQVRFADRLRIEIKVDPGALNSLVPCFLLQPIVENAIRHGIAPCEDDGLVQTTIRRDGDMLRLEVQDSGRKLIGNPKAGNGIGLKNTRERLAHFYDEAYDMQAGPLESGGFRVSILIPYESS